MHHSGETYNFGAALRQSYQQVTVSWLWTLPFALVVSPTTYVIFAQWNTAYQFWVHTCVVRRLGPLEWVLSTPSHHRMHHDRRLHKNFGGILIIWDRMFGTFIDENDIRPQPDEDSPKSIEGGVVMYGIAQPMDTWTDPVTQTQVVSRMLARLRLVLSGSGA